MTKVIAIMSMSLDGYVADPNDGVAEVFDWYFSGDVEIPMPIATSDFTFHVSAPSADHVRGLMAEVGAFLTGRRTFERADGWGGRHPMDVTTVVLTHRLPEDRPAADENFVFVTEGIEAAVAAARKIAGDKNVIVNGGQMAQQALDAGLLDEIGVDVVPVLLGAGTPFFPSLGIKPVQLEGPISVVQGLGVTHLTYRVKK